MELTVELWQIFYSIDVLNAAINQGTMVFAVLLKVDYDGSLQPAEQENILFSPYATVWAKGRCYVLGKRAEEEELSHYRIDHLKDIRVTEMHADLFFGGLNLQEYVRKELLKEDINIIHAVVEMVPELWEETVEHFRDCRTLTVTQDRLRLMIIIR